MALRQLPEEFKEFINLLNENRVQYLIVGGWAVGYYAVPRFTADLDVWIAVSEKNLEKVIVALEKFGMRDVPPQHFKAKGNVLRFGRPPLKVEILSEATGCNFDACWKRRKIAKIQNLNLKFISKSDLIKNKRATGRNKDSADLDALNS